MRLVNYIAALVLMVALLVSASGCSFILDFAECEVDRDCQTFDDPGAGEFFVCSSDEKCVLEPQRECREDAHCSGEASCEDGQCAE
jgi:hypothetical protein